MMTFAAPHYLWLLLLFPPGMLVFFWWSAREQRRLMTQFVQARLLPGLVAGVSSSRQKLRAAGLIVAVICLILALARPQWGYDLEEVTQRGLDIVVALDTSKSMLAADVVPNRLARARLAVLDLMQQAKSDRLGLVAFAGSAFLQCPLTIDDVAFRQSLEALNVNTIPQGGTAIAEAIETALNAFKEGDNYKVLVLFTDGEDHDSGALDAARRAAEAGLRIFTIGIGSTEGEVLAIKDDKGQVNYVRDENGNVVKSHLNEKLLQEIADAAHGFYLPLRAANTIDVLYQKGLAPLPKSQFKEKWVRRLRERYHWPLALGIVLLMAETLLPERKRSVRRSTGAAIKAEAVPTAILLCLLIPIAASGSTSSALREYKSGRYDLSLREYERLLEKKTDDPRLYFNAGTAAYRQGKYDRALKHFDRALTSPDVNLQEQTYYNLGNTLFQLGAQDSDPSKKTEHWEESLRKYESSLKLNPQDADAKFNHEFVKQKLEELKKQQQQQQQQQSKSQQNQKQDQNEKEPNQQNQSAKNDQQQNSQSQPRDQKSDSSQQQAQNQQQPQQKNQRPQPEKDQSTEPQQTNAVYAAGQMTPEQAKQLLDSQKNEELLMPVSRADKPSTPRGPIKDW